MSAMFALGVRALSGLDYKIVLIVLGCVSACAVSAAVIGFCSARWTPKPDTTSENDFLDGNLRSEVPFLVDGDVKILDSTIIPEYIEDKWPDHIPLRLRDPAGRARARMIEDTYDSHYEAINWGFGEAFWFGHAEGDLASHLRSAAA
ncbi:hypothetical protein LTS17_002268 [Exophiala oligosperma]